MTMRAFENPFPPEPSEDWKIDHAHFASLTSDLLHATVRGAFSEGMPTSKSLIVYTGLTGQLFAFHAVSTAPCLSPADRELAVSATSRLLTLCDSLPSIPKSRHPESLLCGELGIHTVMALVRDSLPAASSAIGNVLDLIPVAEASPADEVLYGRAGALVALSSLRQTFGSSSALTSAASTIVAATLKSGKELYATQSPAKKATLPPLTYQWHAKMYIGAAHGFSGVYRSLLLWKELLSAEDLALVKACMDWLVAEVTANGGLVRSSADGSSTDKVHWCHGPAGVVYALLAADDVFGGGDGDGSDESPYLTAAKLCGEVVWKAGLLRKGPGICHGVAGSGFALLRLFQHTRDARWLYRACQCGRFLTSAPFLIGASTPDTPHSLFEGLAGTMLFAAALADPDLCGTFPFTEPDVEAVAP